jgi:glycosyltransferase involved in cell wall biosynthesis
MARDTSNQWVIIAPGPLTVELANFSNIKIITGGKVRTGGKVDADGQDRTGGKVKTGGKVNAGIFKSFLHIPWQQIILPLAIMREKPDIFWSPHHFLPPLPRGIPMVVTVHDLVWAAFPRDMRRVRRLAESILMPAAVRRAARVIAVSNATAGDIYKYIPGSRGKVDVIYEALVPLMEAAPSTAAATMPEAAMPTEGVGRAGDADADISGVGASPKIPGGDSTDDAGSDAIASSISRTRADAGDSPYVLFVGSTHERKNLRALLRAYAGLPEDLKSSYKLVVAGADAWGGDIRETIRQCGLAGHVRQTGYVGRAELSALYRGASAFIMPSLLEGFGLPILEAMSAGVPVLTSDCTALSETAGEAALKVDPQSEAQIRAGLIRILTDETLRRTLISRGRARVEEFSWRKAARETLAVFHAALNKNRPK